MGEEESGGMELLSCTVMTMRPHTIIFSLFSCHYILEESTCLLSWVYCNFFFYHEMLMNLFSVIEFSLDCIYIMLSATIARSLCLIAYVFISCAVLGVGTYLIASLVIFNEFWFLSCFMADLLNSLVFYYYVYSD